MPTAAKLVSFVFFALLAYVIAEQLRIYTAEGLMKPTLQPETIFGNFPYVAAAIAGVSGWLVVGPVAGRPHGGRAMRRTVAYGLRTAFTMAFFVIVLFSAREMILLSMKMRYHGPFEALQAMVGYIVAYAKLLLHPVLGGLLVGGGMLGGVLAEITAKFWR